VVVVAVVTVAVVAVMVVGVRVVRVVVGTEPDPSDRLAREKNSFKSEAWRYLSKALLSSLANFPTMSATRSSSAKAAICIEQTSWPDELMLPYSIRKSSLLANPKMSAKNSDV
jgi:hypothetical protein